jgi:hypothetical protein
MWRLRPLLWPALMLLLGGWSVYDNFIAPNPMWRYPKAEAAAILFTVIGVLWLPFGIYRVMRPLPVAVGTVVAFTDHDKNMVSGTIVSVNGGACVVRTPRGDYTLDRTDLVIDEAATARNTGGSPPHAPNT